MAPSFVRHAFSRRSPWLTAAILLTIATVAVFGPDREPAHAATAIVSEPALAAEAEPQVHQLEICSTLDDNGDTVLDSPIVRFDVSMRGGPALLDNYTYYAVEGRAVCSWFVLEDFDLDPAGTIVVTEDESELPTDWAHAAGYPKHSVSGQPLQPGGTATLSYSPGETQKSVTIVNKLAVQDSPAPTASPHTRADSNSNRGGAGSPASAQQSSTAAGLTEADRAVSQPTPVAPSTGNADANPSRHGENELTLLLLVLAAFSAALGFGAVIHKAGEPIR